VDAEHLLGYNCGTMSSIRSMETSSLPAHEGELREAAERILGSGTFSRSPRLRSFLEFVVGCAVAGRVQEINEYSLGVQVFGKPANYAPNEDNIVRVTARQLRVKLEEYYRGEGAKDEWRLEIPKGGYMPEVRRNEPARRRGWKWVPEGAKRAGWGVLLVSGWAMAALLLVSRPGPPVAPPAYLLEGVFAGEGTAVLCVLDDPMLPMTYRGRESQPSLNEFLNGSYRERQAYGPETYDLLARSAFLRPHTVRFLLQLSEIALMRGKQVKAVHAREASPEMLGGSPAVLLGGIGSNPWVEAFQKNLDFTHTIDPRQDRRSFINRWPREGEAEAYVSQNRAPGLQLYARIAVLPNPYGPGKAVLLGGTSTAATEGAWQFALTGRAVEEVERRCGGPVGRLEQFEVILETRALGVTPVDWRIEAVRCGANPRLGKAARKK
jgi:hypothetical protein